MTRIGIAALLVAVGGAGFLGDAAQAQVVDRCQIYRQIGRAMPAECGGRDVSRSVQTRGRLLVTNPDQGVPARDQANEPQRARSSDSQPSRTVSVQPATDTPPAPSADNPRSANLSSIQFELGSDRLTSQAMQQLDIVAEVIKDSTNASDRFVIIGHTDARGGDEMNLELSRRRAHAVVEYLASRHGIPRERLDAQGVGRTQPLVSNDPYDARNRRVQVSNIGSN